MHSYLPNPVLFDFGFISIHWYGFLMTLAIVVGFFFAKFLFKKYKIPEAHLYNLVFYLVLFGLIGARLYHVLNEIGFYWTHPLQILAVWNGGLALHGALLAGVLTMYFYIKKYIKYFNIKSLPVTSYQLPVTLLRILDILAPALAIGQAIGRWGNYFNQELYGMPTSLPWGHSNRA